MKHPFVLLIALLITGMLSGVEPLPVPDRGEVNAVLASVNGDPVSLLDILPLTRNQEYQAYAVYAGERLAEEIHAIRLKALEDRIDRMLILEEYRREPFPIPGQTVEEELDNIAERMGVRSRSEFTRKLRETGTTIEQLRKEIEEYIVIQMMLFDRVRAATEITPREIHEYYQRHRVEFAEPETLELGMILLSLNDTELERKVAALQTALDADPEQFAPLAAQYSAGPDAASGGSLGWIERRRLRAEFAAAMPELTVGKVYGPVRTVDGVSFLKVLAHRAENTGDFKTLGPEIRRRIEQEEREKIRDAYLEKLREKAILRYYI